MNGHRRWSISIFLAVLVLFGVSLASAQDSLDQQPLLKMLANVPDNANNRSEIYFNDRKAVEVAYPSAKMPADWATFSAVLDDQGQTESLKSASLWWKIWREQQSSSMSNYFMFMGDMSKTVGFDFFAIEQELSYGQPPQQSLQLSGSFDLEKVRAALTSRKYTQQDQSGVEVWCGPDGCDGGAKVNLQEHNPANPFGGELGRNWPIIMQPNELIGSPDLSVIQDHITVIKTNGASLAQAPEYRAAVDGLSHDGVLMQAYFWDSQILAGLSQLDPLLAGIPSELRKRVVADMLKNYEPLPAFKLLAFGDMTNDQEMAGEAVLVYDSEADAKKAVEVLPKRIANYTTLATQRPLMDLFANRGVIQPRYQVINSGNEYVVLATFPSAKLSDADILSLQSPADGEGSGNAVPPGAAYRLLMGLMMRMDNGWLIRFRVTCWKRRPSNYSIRA